MKIKLVHPFAKVPAHSTRYAAGADLCSVEEMIIQPQSRAVVGTGVCIELPEFYYGQIAPRSGLAVKKGVMTMAGIIDADYRGEINVVLYNSDKEATFRIDRGDRIAQLIIKRHYTFDFEEVSELSETVRAEGGFGSTGVQ